MMNFVPRIYDDELFYSIMARYKRMCGMTSRRAFLKDLFNKNAKVNGINFPQYIDLFVSNLPANSKIDADFIIKNNTMYPLYTVFMSDKRSEAVYRAMAEGGIRSIANIAGTTGNRVKMWKHLRYCPVCFREDIELEGESYWRRIHQVPGVLCCDKHKVVLRGSKILNTDSILDYHCLDEDTCSDTEENNVYDEKIINLNLKYSENVRRLLNNDYPRKEPEFIVGYYIDKLREKGLASQNGSIYMKELLQRFTECYPSEYLEIMQSNVDIESHTNWIRQFVRNDIKNKSPLRHLLFAQYLDIDIEEMMHCNKVTGKVKLSHDNSHSFDVEKRKAMWMKIVNDNPDSTRSELKNIGKWLHDWIRKYEKDWYEEVTPRCKKKNKSKDLVDWDKRDEECLELSKVAVEKILSDSGKPVRIGMGSIKRKIGINGWFYDERLKKTHEYIDGIKEDIRTYRIRKIKWGIEEMIKQREKITPYQIQLFCGFGGSSDSVIQLIKEILEDRI